MQPQARSLWMLVLGATVGIALALGGTWAVAPDEVRGLLLVGGCVLTVAVYLVLYAGQRRHWR